MAVRWDVVDIGLILALALHSTTVYLCLMDLCAQCDHQSGRTRESGY